MPYNGGDNNDGITVIDISDLNAVKYCFVFLDLISNSGREETNTPLTGEEYVDVYLHRNDDEENSDEENSDEENSDEENSDEENSDEENSDEENSDEENSDEEVADDDVMEATDDPTDVSMSVHGQPINTIGLIEDRTASDNESNVDDILMESRKREASELIDVYTLKSVWPDGSWYCPPV